MNLVENEEQEEGSESETGFVDLDEDTLHNVLSRVDVDTLGRVAGVNRLWRKVSQDERLWEPIVISIWAGVGEHGSIDEFRKEVPKIFGFRRLYTRHLVHLSFSPPSEFYSIDPKVFKIQPFSDNASVSRTARTKPDFLTIVFNKLENVQIKLSFWDHREYDY